MGLSDLFSLRAGCRGVFGKKRIVDGIHPENDPLLRKPESHKMPGMRRRRHQHRIAFLVDELLHALDNGASSVCVFPGIVHQDQTLAAVDAIANGRHSFGKGSCRGKNEIRTEFGQERSNPAMNFPHPKGMVGYARESNRWPRRRKCDRFQGNRRKHPGWRLQSRSGDARDPPDTGEAAGFVQHDREESAAK